MTDQEFGTEADSPRLNSLYSKAVVLEAPGQIIVKAEAPSYISYAHYQNQDLVSKNHGIRVWADVQSLPTDGTYTLSVSLKCQGRPVSEPSFLSIAESHNSVDGTTISYKLDGDFLFEVREATPAVFEISILDGANEVRVGQIETQIFPANLWSMGNEGGLGTAGLMLSTFIRPRDPNLDGLLTKARQIKGTLKSDQGHFFEPNTRGYQGGDEEVMAEVRALFEAVQASGIYYSNPAGSEDWNIGQLIRSNEEILSAKAATCLDSTILFASLLENIQIRPLIALVPGHAFVGFWTKSGSTRTLSNPVATAEEALQGVKFNPPLLRFVETTTMCESNNKSSFEDAVRKAEETLSNALLRAESDERWQDDWRVIDVSLARRYGYRPLPTKVKNADGSSSIVEFSVELVKTDLNIQVDVAKLGAIKDDSPPRVKYWKSQLLDLTFNNPLLNMNRRSASQIKLIIPRTRLGSVEDFLQQKKAELKLKPGLVARGEQAFPIFLNADGTPPTDYENIIETAFTGEQSLYFEGPKGKRLPSAEAFERAAANKARNLHKASRNSIEETGTNNLYMTFGALRWKRKDANSEKDPYILSPLILMPVTLRAIDRGRVWAVALDESNELATNETLALKLMQDWGISIPALTAPVEDEAGIDIPALIDAVRIAVSEAKQTTWQITEDATIGTYDFSTFHMWKDLNDNWQKLSESPLVKHLIETDGTEAFLDPLASQEEITEEDLDKELARVPVPSDGTQLRAVIRSLRGESFIIQGPPGTGKSQTITNLLARNLQEGKKVLFMSEKPAALEVVKDRLDEIRLGNFVLDLHSKNTSAESIRGQLLAALDASPKVDTVGIETEMFDFDVATKALTKYPERLHRINETHGHSVYSVRDTLLKLPASQSLTLTRGCLGFFNGENLLRFKSNMANIQDVGELAGIAGENPWGFSNLIGPIDTSIRDRLAPLTKMAVTATRRALASADSTLALEQITKKTEIEGIAKLPSQTPSQSELQLLVQLENKQKLNLHLDILKALYSKIIDKKTASTRFGSISLSDLEAEYRTAQEAKLFKKKKLETLSQKISNFWSAPIHLETLGSVLQEAKDIYELGRRVSESSLGIPGIELVEASSLYEEGQLANRLAKAQDVLVAAEAYSTSNEPALKAFLDLSKDARAEIQSCLSELVKLFEAVAADENSITLWLAGGNLLARLNQVVQKWDDAAQDGQFNSLARWSNLLELILDLKNNDQLAAYNEILSGAVSFTDAPRAFDRARLSLLLEKLIDEHELATFSSATQSANISKLKRSADALRVYNRDTIASAVVKSRTFDPTAVAGRAGALRSEINKQRGRLPIRQLMKKYWETITEITPCVAASPDSVARFLDVGLAHFDLVVFDEASQLRVPNSIGALGRGKSAVIVGDSKQMPPTNFFTSGSSEDEEEEEFQISQPDVESILTMAEFSKLPSVMLKWHYRSQDEALIAFSNANYYQNELASFPSPRDKSVGDPAIVFKFVKDAEYIRGSKTRIQSPLGKTSELTQEQDDEVLEEAASYASNTNAKEAQAVVDHIIELHKEFGSSLNLGVVTMNESQRRKIAELLENQADPELRKLVDSKQTKDYVFVRPLEKVQGDERDIIIMSIGFAQVPDPKNPKTFKLPQNFGPLTKAGSEKRLNVAVTRARKKVYVFCSFDPSLLRITDTSSEGMKGLKTYLTIAQEGPDNVILGGQTSFEEPDRHRIDVARAIEAMGYKTSQNVGLSNFKVDVAIEHPEKPGEYLLALLLDGPNWRKRPAANDRDVLPVGILEKNMGWKGVERIWLPVWLKDSEGEKLRIKSRIEELLRHPEQKDPALAIRDISELPTLDDLIASSQVAAIATSPIAIDKSVIGVNIEDIEPFGEVNPTLVTDDKSHIQYTDNPEVKRVIGELVANLARIEGPVHPDRAVNYIARCFGLSRVQTARATAILTAIPRSRFTRDEEGFIYPEGASISSYTSWKRKNKGEPRDIAMISLTEIGNAMRDLCDRTHGLESEELMRQTMLAFGPKTLSAPIRQRLEKAIKTASERKLIVLDGGHYVPGT